MATVRIYKVAELLNTTSQEVLDLLKKNHGIELKSASSTLEEIVARQFVERLAKQRGIELPKGDIFSEQAVKSAKGKSGAPARKGGAPAEPPRPAVPTLGPPRLVKKPLLVKPIGEPAVAHAAPGGSDAHDAVAEAPVEASTTPEPASAVGTSAAAGSHPMPALANEPVAETPAAAAPAEAQAEPAPIAAGAASAEPVGAPAPPLAPPRPTGRFVPPSIRLRVEEPGQAPPQAPPLVPKRAIVPQQPPRPAAPRPAGPPQSQPPRPGGPRTTYSPSGRPTGGMTPAMLGGPRPLPSQPVRPNQPGLPPRPGMPGRPAAALRSAVPPPAQRRPPAPGPAPRRAAAHALTRRAGRAAADFADDHAGRRHDREGPRRQARRPREGSAQGPARPAHDDDHQFGRRHGHGSRGRPILRRPDRDANLRGGAARNRVGSRRPEGPACHARRWSP